MKDGSTRDDFTREARKAVPDEATESVLLSGGKISDGDEEPMLPARKGEILELHFSALGNLSNGRHRNVDVEGLILREDPLATLTCRNSLGSIVQDLALKGSSVDLKGHGLPPGVSPRGTA
jgi:hypothetical protein